MSVCVPPHPAPVAKAQSMEWVPAVFICVYLSALRFPVVLLLMCDGSSLQSEVDVWRHDLPLAHNMGHSSRKS